MNPELWQRVESWLERLEELSPAEQRALLDRECADDPELRREVAAQLRVAAAAEGFFDTPAFPLVERTSESAEQVPSRLGAYRLGERLGSGGMSEVFLAHRADGEFQQQVALKLLALELAHPDLVRRFRDERQILARLEHPNIARLIDGGTAGDGRPYLVMEHVEGQTIDRWCRDRELATEERLRLVCKVCGAVQAAHQSLVVHRDLKPSNILVDASGEPKLLDFGIAKALEPDSVAEGFVDVPTGEGARWMTPAYASPEQIRGEPATTATDVHALGLLLYELLTGRHPYGEDSESSITHEIGTREPPLPSTSAPPALRARLAGDLDAIVTKALCKDPEGRYATAAQLLEDLERHLAQQPVLARRPSFAYLAGLFVRRNRLGVGLAGLLLVLLSTSGAIVFHLWQQAEREETRAREVAVFLEDLFQLPDPRRDEGSTVTALELLQRSARHLDRGLEQQPEDRAALILAVGSAYRGLGQNEEAARFLRRGLELHRTAGEEADRRRVQALLDLAAVERALGDIESASARFAEVLAQLDRGGSDQARLARLANNHASLIEWEGDFVRAEQLYRRVLGMKLRLYGPRHEDVATAWNNLATTLMQVGEYAEAEQLYRQALALRLELHGADSPRTLGTENNLAVLLRDQGRLEEAEALLRTNLLARKRLLGAEHPASGIVLNNLAMTRRLAGDIDEARELYAEALRLFLAAYGPDHANTAVVERNRAALELAAGELATAEAAARRAFETFRAQLGEHHWRSADAASVLGACSVASGERETGEMLLREAVAVLETTKGEKARESREARRRLAAAAP